MNGVPQVATGLNSVILGKAGQDYNDAILQGSKAMLTSKISADVTDIHQQYPNDAQAFQTAVKAKASAYQNMYPGALGNSLADMTNNLGAQHYSNIVENDIRLQTQTSLQAISTNIDDTNSQLRVLARQGAINTPEYDRLTDQLQDAYDDLGSNKSFGYSAEKIASEQDHAFDMLNGEYIVGRVDDVFTKKGKAAAQQVLDDQVRNNPDLKLSDQERNQLYAQGMAHLAYLSGEQSAQIAAIKPLLDHTTEILAKGNPDGPSHLSESQLDQISSQINSIGDIKSVESFQAARLAANRDVAFKGLSPDQRASTLLGASAAGVGGPIASGVNSEQGALQFFVSKGWTPAQAAGIVGNLVHESGGRLNPGAINPGDGSDGSDSIGIGQWNSTRAAALKQFAASQGKPVTDFGTQLAFVQHELETSESAAAQRLRGAGNVQDATSAFALGYERPQGFQTGNLAQVAGGQNRLDQANRIAASGGNTSGVTSVGTAKYTAAEAQANPYIADAFLQQNMLAAKDEIRVGKALAETISNSVKFSGQVTPDVAPVAATIYQLAARHPADLG